MRVVCDVGKRLGTMGVLDRKLLKKFDIECDVLYSELVWPQVFKLAAKAKTLFTPIPRTQPVRRDLALLIDSNVAFSQIEETVRATEKKLLRSVVLFDVYEGKNLPAGKKSYAVRITLQDDEKTLQDKQIDAIMRKITDALRSKLGAELR